MFVLASNHFRKCFSVNVGVWLRMENKFSENGFQLTVCFSWFDPEMVWSENFHFKPFSDSRAKREREREREEEERAQIMPSTSSRSHPKIAPRRHQSHWDRNWEMVGFRWIWPYLTGFDEFFLVGFCFCVYLLRNCIIYLFRSWKNIRNKKKMCFLYYFQKHNQTLENIFQSIYWNATKHLKIFSFPKNSISEKYLFSGKYFTQTKHSLSYNSKHVNYI